MAKEKKQEEKIELEREYIIPLRKKVLRVPKYKRAKKAIKIIREFLARHMKVEERDMKKIKIDKFLNQEIWFRGIKKPPAKIKVKAVKKNGIVYAELLEIPEKVKWDIEKEKKKKKEAEKIKKKPEKEEKPVEEEKTEEEKEEEKEKEKSVVEAGLAAQKIQAKEAKHTTRIKQPKQTQVPRKTLKR